MLKNILDSREDLQQYLFIRGYLITSNNLTEKRDEYPFYSNWNTKKIGSFYFWTHKLQKLFYVKKNNITFFLIGHAYNPFSGDYDENVILQKMADAYNNDEYEYIDILNELTGIYTIGICDDEKISVFGDCTGMQTTFYGIVNEKLYVSSHTQLLGDICNLDMDSYVKELVSYRFYKLLGNCLPGDISPYKGIKRLIPNTYVKYQDGTFETKRFFPVAKIEVCQDEEYQEVIKQAAIILSNSMKLIHKKWEKPAISLTGGCDSKTTLSCTNGEYKYYQYFSYISSNEEAIDAIAAEEICKQLGLKHTTYNIPNSNGEFSDFEVYRKILEYNSGNIGKSNLNDIRKRIYFIHNKHFDVEVKSWVSEVARAYYYKRFAKKSFPKYPTPRYLTTMYKVFVNNRQLVLKTDLIFRDYLDKYYTVADFDYLSWVDLFFWEFRMGSWSGLVITGEHRISFDITIPYNNRKLLMLLLSVPIEKRIQDIPHKDIMYLTNPKIANMGISVTNVKHTPMRAFFEKCYLNIHSNLPF